MILSWESSIQSRTGKTDARGNFTFSDVPTGSFRIYYYNNVAKLDKGIRVGYSNLFSVLTPLSTVTASPLEIGWDFGGASPSAGTTVSTFSAIPFSWPSYTAFAKPRYTVEIDSADFEYEGSFYAGASVSCRIDLAAIKAPTSGSLGTTKNYKYTIAVYDGDSSGGADGAVIRSPSVAFTVP